MIRVDEGWLLQTHGVRGSLASANARDGAEGSTTMCLGRSGGMLARCSMPSRVTSGTTPDTQDCMRAICRGFSICRDAAVTVNQGPNKHATDVVTHLLVRPESA